MKLEDKRRAVSDLQQRLQKARVAILTRFSGINVTKMTRLRRELRQAAVDFRVIKNTLFRLAIKGTDKEHLSPYMEGPVAVALSEQDPVAPARVLAKFAKDAPELKIMMASSDGKLFGAAEIQTWVNLPSLDGMRGIILGLLQAPATQLARLTVTPGTRIARVISAHGQQEG